MNKSLSLKDFELVLDYQSGDCPAVVKERLFETPPDQMPIDFARIGNKHCWVVSNHDVFVWTFGGQNYESARSRLVHLRLPPSGLVYSSKLISVFDRVGKQKPAGALAVSREGVARYWPTLSRDSYVDSVLDLNREVAMDIHLLETSTSDLSAEFILVTTSGSVYSLTGSVNGQISSVRVGARETLGIAGRLTSFIFGSGSSNETTHLNGSVLYWRESEEVEDNDEEAQDVMTIVFGANTIFAFDVSNKSEVWAVETQKLFGDIVEDHFNKTSDDDVTDVSVTILDVQSFRNGVIVLLSGTHSTSESVSFFLAHLCEFDYHSPKVGYFAEVPSSENIRRIYDVQDESSYLGQVHLCIPKETATSGNLMNTDGLLIVHPVYVQSAYVPDDFTKKSDVPLSKTIMLSTNDQIVGYGVDKSFCYVILTDGRIAALRLLPKGFADNSICDEVSILDVIANMERPMHNDTLGTMFDAFIAFCEKSLVQATSIIDPVLDKATPGELLKDVFTFMWNEVENIDEECDFELELRQKKKFFEYFILFLKHTEALTTVFNAKCFNTRLDCNMKGTEMISEIGERIQVLLSLNFWASVHNDHADVLRHVCKEIGKEVQYQKSDTELKFAYIHLIPRAVVRICKALIDSSAFKSANQRYETLCLAADLLHTFSTAISLARRVRNIVPFHQGNVKWTTTLAECFTQLSLMLFNEIDQQGYGDIERNKFRDFATKLVTFNLSEATKNPEGHPGLNTLCEIGDERTAIDLSERFKDFKIICRVTLQYDKEVRRKKLDEYKLRFASDDFETYLYNYMNARHMYDELLEQSGSRADEFIASLDHIRWRRELQEGQYTEASKTLLLESERENEDLNRQKILSSIARLAYHCQDEEKQSPEDLDEIDLNQRVVEYQECLPIDLIKSMYPDNPHRPLSPKELIEICKMRLDEDSAGIQDHIAAVLFIARLLKWQPDSEEYQDALLHVWISVVKSNDWEKIKKPQMRKTDFARIMKWLRYEERDIALYALPDVALLVSRTSLERMKCPDSAVFIKVTIHDAKKDLVENP